MCLIVLHSSSSFSKIVQKILNSLLYSLFYNGTFFECDTVMKFIISSLIPGLVFCHSVFTDILRSLVVEEIVWEDRLRITEMTNFVSIST